MHQERTCEVHTHYRHPLLDRQLLERNPVGGHAGIVEQHIQPSKRVTSRRKQRSHGRRIADVRSDNARTYAGRSGVTNGLLQQVGPATRQYNGISVFKKPDCDGSADAASRSRDNCNLRWGVHVRTVPQNGGERGFEVAKSAYSYFKAVNGLTRDARRAGR